MAAPPADRIGELHLGQGRCSGGDSWISTIAGAVRGTGLSTQVNSLRKADDVSGRCAGWRRSCPQKASRSMSGWTSHFSEPLVTRGVGWLAENRAVG